MKSQHRHAAWGLMIVVSMAAVVCVLVRLSEAGSDRTLSSQELSRICGGSDGPGCEIEFVDDCSQTDECTTICSDGWDPANPEPCTGLLTEYTDSPLWGFKYPAQLNGRHARPPLSSSEVLCWHAVQCGEGSPELDRKCMEWGEANHCVTGDPGDECMKCVVASYILVEKKKHARCGSCP
jgi:hypothetical protein